MVALILAILLAFPCPVPGNFYDRQAMVVGSDCVTDVVTVEDSEGFIWEFYGSDSYEDGDSVVLLMWDNRTPELIFDDAVSYCFLLSSPSFLPA